MEHLELALVFESTNHLGLVLKWALVHLALALELVPVFELANPGEWALELVHAFELANPAE